MPNVKNALLSVYDKTGIVEFAHSLSEMGISIVSTGGTSKLLTDNGINHTKVEDLTKFPEKMDGRVKTLHPNIFMGLLARRESEAHMNELKSSGLSGIDLVVVNLYPFEETVKKESITLAEAIEQIDIGGVSLLRAGAKNYKDVLSVTSPDQYEGVSALLKENEGRIEVEESLKYAAKVFELTTRYDSCINSFLDSQTGETDELSNTISQVLDKIQDLRYGENPHQRAALYCAVNEKLPYEQLHGKELSYNNLIDIDSAITIAKAFEKPAVSIIKHTNPCGVAADEVLTNAYDKALSTDPLSAFGGIIGFNRSLDPVTAGKISKMFVEVVAAPDFEEDSFDILSKKKNIRIIKINSTFNPALSYLEMKKIQGGMLVQEKDAVPDFPETFKSVTKREPTSEEWEALLFGWNIIRHVKSNAILYCSKDQTLGIGTGQMSRVDSSEIAVFKAGNQNLDLKGSALISDAFFPFRDGVDAAAKAGAVTVIQPGGSVRDEEVIAACDEHDMSMVFTGKRHFKH